MKDKQCVQRGIQALAAVAAACAALAASAQPRDYFKMSKEEIAAHDKAEWGAPGKLGADDLKEYNQLKEAVASLEKTMDKALADKVFMDVSKDSTMQALMAALQKSLVTNKRRLNAPPGSFEIGDSASQGIKALDSLTVMLDGIDKKSRHAVMELVDFAIVTRLPQQRAKIAQAVERLEVWQHTKTLADFDEKYAKFLRLVGSCKAYELQEISGPSMLRISGLDKYATEECRKEPFFDRDLRTIDSYLAPLSEKELSSFKKSADLFENAWNSALATVRKDYAYFREHALNITPTDRKAVDALYYDFGIILEDAQAWIESAKAIVAKVEDSGSEVGKLRSCNVSNAGGWVNCAGSVQSNGSPGYSRRGRRALEDLKDAFKKRRRDLGLVKCTWE